MGVGQSSLSNIQIELLKLFSTNLSENDMRELKEIIAVFYAQKSIEFANQAWLEKKVTNAEIESWLNGKEQ